MERNTCIISPIESYFAIVWKIDNKIRWKFYLFIHPHTITIQNNNFQVIFEKEEDMHCIDALTCTICCCNINHFCSLDWYAILRWYVIVITDNLSGMMRSTETGSKQYIERFLFAWRDRFHIVSHQLSIVLMFFTERISQ